jgi:hypothetical protein
MQFLTNITNNGRKNLCGRKKKLHKILDATCENEKMTITTQTRNPTDAHCAKHHQA